MLTVYNEEQQIAIKEGVTDFLEHMIKREDKDTWIILEIARDKEIKFLLGQYDNHCHYLFDDANEELQESGAIALCINEVPEILTWITEHWGKNWFSFFITEYDRNNVAKHLSSLCYLSSHEKMYLFRYYEPITFTCWISGLKEVNRVNEALGLFSEVYVETPLPHMLMQYVLEDKNVNTRAINLEDKVEDFSSLEQDKETFVFSLKGCWYMGQKEYEYLAPVPLNAFKIKLCKSLIEMHNLLEKYTLTEIYTRINKVVERAVLHGFLRKDTLANFVNIYFEHRSFWEMYANEVDRILSLHEVDEVERIEFILKTVFEWKDKESQEGTS